MIRSFDPELFQSVLSKEEIADVDAVAWVSNPMNFMFDEKGSVGLLTYEYPGVYSGHWFFKVGGRKALDLAKKMIAEMFDNQGMKALRGLTPVDKRAACWAARQIGMKSYGVMAFPNGDHEVFVMTKQEFEDQR